MNGTEAVCYKLCRRAHSLAFADSDNEWGKKKQSSGEQIVQGNMAWNVLFSHILQMACTCSAYFFHVRFYCFPLFIFGVCVRVLVSSPIHAEYLSAYRKFLLNFFFFWCTFGSICTKNVWAHFFVPAHCWPCLFKLHRANTIVVNLTGPATKWRLLYNMAKHHV